MLAWEHFTNYPLAPELSMVSLLSVLKAEKRINQVRVLPRPKPPRAAIVLTGKFKACPRSLSVGSLLTSRPQPPAAPGVGKVHSRPRAFALLAHQVWDVLQPKSPWISFTTHKSSCRCPLLQPANQTKASPDASYFTDIKACVTL